MDLEAAGQALAKAISESRVIAVMKPNDDMWHGGWTDGERQDAMAWMEENGIPAYNVPLGTKIMVLGMDCETVVWTEYVRHPESDKIQMGPRCSGTHLWNTDETDFDCRCSPIVILQMTALKTPMPEHLKEKS